MKDKEEVDIRLDIEIHFHLGSSTITYKENFPLYEKFTNMPLFIGRETEYCGLKSPSLKVVDDDPLDTYVMLSGIESSMTSGVDAEYIIGWLLKLCGSDLPAKIRIWRYKVDWTYLARWEWDPVKSLHVYWDAYLDPKVMKGFSKVIEDKDAYWSKCKEATYDHELSSIRYGGLRDWDCNYVVRIPMYMSNMRDWMKEHNKITDAKAEEREQAKIKKALEQYKG